MTDRVAYLTGEYPRATDTFIQREVAALRAEGLEILTCSVRTTGAEHHVGPEQVAEAAQTFKLLDTAKAPLTLLRAHIRALRSPRRYGGALKLAVQTAPPGLRNLLYQLFYFAEAAVLADHLERQGVSHLHNHIAKSSCTVAMLTSALSGIPYSFTLHGPDIFFAPEHWRLDRKIETARFVSCISDFCRSQAMAFSDAALWDKLHIVHCGIEPERYGTQEERSERPTLLFVGRLAAVKGAPVLLEAFTEVREQVPDCQLVLIGDGPDRTALEARAADMGLRDGVVFAGYKSQAEVAEALEKADVFVLPSFAEGVPVVLMEAMAAEVPVVTTRIAGVPELVENGVTGLLVPPGPSKPLAAALIQLLAHPDLRRKMGAAGRAKVVAEFDSRVEARKLAALFRTSIAEGRV
ncbi:glycosyltransferase family 4 protein [Thalassococcus sp. S3]|uniref:glycosyltransferase family 4 protein n=1 Tax=Thalassococcus sp. S3 TaxID=2017482 RepID=UPI0010247668|nr:glycosyltransferase family 4 protein [Thalassococcus sp. S3]QBF31974.1 colanic acid biosynthesis glycosyltransferase WcaL [Thalassococcus sp. S3]